ncbi:hypothetical protein [Piscinibacter sakaiensis]|uniref:hypothetical protein n=1 Tax=Piscinibacter sakaiensis TaxID=1547922 RepID=UPI003AAC15B3
MTEHFVTYFDSRFLAVGMALRESLKALGCDFHLWVICIDSLAEEQIKRLAFPDMTAIPLSSVEDSRLVAVKGGRSLGEYCWTLTPFAPEAVFNAVSHVDRVTYVDADLFFFSDPHEIFEEFEGSDKHVLITEHAYAPELDRSEESGRFCVQFMIFRRTPEGLRVLRWWQDRCLEWCFDRVEDGKYGDQKYLDEWPTLFADAVHVFSKTEKTLGPWNVDFMLSTAAAYFCPIFYHFQSFRLIDDNTARLYAGVRISRAADRFYGPYLGVVREQLKILRSMGVHQRRMPEPIRKFELLRKIYMALTRRNRYVKL